MSRIQIIRWVLAATVVCCSLRAMAGADSPDALDGAAPRFLAAESKIRNRDDFWAARQRLEAQALRLAEQDLRSKDAEQVLHWVLMSPRTSESVKLAAERLASFHATSDATANLWVNFAMEPREWTLAFFASAAERELTTDQRAVLEVSQAIHRKSLLELSDELQASPDLEDEYALRLGQELTSRLKHLDSAIEESRVVAEFERIADRHGPRMIGGTSARRLAEGGIFAVRHLRLGKIAEELEGNALDGGTIGLKSLRGQAVLVHFGATWCMPCLAAIPALKQLRADHQHQELAIVWVGVDRDRRDLDRIVQKHQIEWHVIADSDETLQKQWQVLSLPSYFVLDQEHVIRYRGGSLSRAAGAIDSLFANDAGAVARLLGIALQTFDKNNDERIERDELPAEKQAIIDLADNNDDGVLSIHELKAYLTKSLTSPAETSKRAPAGPSHD